MAEALVGFAPTNGSFADSCVSYFATAPYFCAGQTTALVTWLPGHIFARDRPYLYFFAMLWPYEI